MRTRSYAADLTDAQWALVAPHIPAAKSGGRPRTTDVRAVLDAIIYLLRTGCQWRQLPSDFPPWPTVDLDHIPKLTRDNSPSHV
jgi:putative transposase